MILILLAAEDNSHDIEKGVLKSEAVFKQKAERDSHYIAAYKKLQW